MERCLKVPSIPREESTAAVQDRETVGPVFLDAGVELPHIDSTLSSNRTRRSARRGPDPADAIPHNSFHRIEIQTNSFYSAADKT